VQNYASPLCSLRSFQHAAAPCAHYFCGELFGVFNAMSHGLSKDMFVTQLVPFMPLD
jgi:hypothetical protein